MQIDIHSKEKKYRSALEKFKQDKVILPANKKLILDFLNDCELGKTIKNKQRKKVGASRCHKYLSILKSVSAEINKPFDKIVQKDMENYIQRLENDTIKATRKKQGKIIKWNYSPETKLDRKKTILKFYKWLSGNNDHYPDLVSFFDMTPVQEEIQALTRQEIERAIEYATKPLWKAFIMVLFNSGARVSELQNVRIKHLTKQKYGDSSCYWLWIEYPKTSSFKRNIPLTMSTKILDNWLQEHPDKDNPEAQLFPVNYEAIKMALKRIGIKSIKKQIRCHLLRHSGATYDANNGMPYFQFCKKYGWSMNSKEPKRYIDRQGIDLEPIAKAGDVEVLDQLKIDNKKLKEEILDIKQQMLPLLELLHKDKKVGKMIKEKLKTN